MTTAPAPVRPAARTHQTLTSGHLPRWAPWGLLAASLVVCLGTWFVIEKTRLGAYLRAGTENPKLVEAFGVNVPLMITLTYGFGVALAAFAGVLAAPIYSVNPNMGGDLIIVVFAVVVVATDAVLAAVLAGCGGATVEGEAPEVSAEPTTSATATPFAEELPEKPTGPVPPRTARTTAA